MFFIDSDNAMASPSGDVDDGYAIASMILAGAPIDAISSVSGNTTEPLAFRNNEMLCALLGWSGRLVRGPAAEELLSRFRGRILALGPLTNVAAASPPAAEIILVGGRLRTRGRWPPFWPYEFNLTRDARAACRVFALEAPLTIFPLDVARELWIEEEDLRAIGGPLGEYFRAHSARWFRHLRWTRWTGRFPIYDLAATLYALDPSGFTMATVRARMHGNTWIEYEGKGPAEAGAPEAGAPEAGAPEAGAPFREVTVCRALNRRLLWERFLALAR